MLHILTGRAGSGKTTVIINRVGHLIKYGNAYHSDYVPNNLTEQDVEIIGWYADGELDELPELMKFADNLEKATITTIEDGVMTGDLAALSTLENKQTVTTEEFLLAVNERLQKLM